jgi:hypothetical protein
VATQHCEAARLLRQKSPLRKHFQNDDDIGDPSGYLAFANSRSFVPRPSKANKQALTPEAAESASNNLYNGACIMNIHLCGQLRTTHSKCIPCSCMVLDLCSLHVMQLL